MRRALIGGINNEKHSIGKAVERQKLKLNRSHVCTEVSRKIPNKVFNTTIRRLVKVAEAPWSGAPTVLLNEPRASGAGAGSLEYWTLAKEFHNRVQSMRREFGVKEHPKLLTGRR